MKDIFSLLKPSVNIWDELFEPDIENYWKGKTPWAKGGSGIIYDLGDGRVCKVQNFYVSGKTNDTFYEKQEGIDIVYIKESFLMEALIMQRVRSYLVPKLFHVACGISHGKNVSVLIMEKVSGIPYQPKLLTGLQLRQLWRPFLKELDRLYTTYLFIHGDLILANMIVSPKNCLLLIDFGLSSIKISDTHIVRYHSYRLRLIPMILNDKTMLRHMRMELTSLSCDTILTFIQKHRQSVDICKLLYYSFSHLPEKLVRLLKTCMGGMTTIAKPTTELEKPNPVLYSRHPITFAQISHFLE